VQPRLERPPLFVYDEVMNRRHFLQSLGVVGAATTLGRPGFLRAAEAAAQPKLKIVSVETYPVRLNGRPGPAAVPKFDSDFDPRRWRYRGPFAQLVGAVVVVIKTDQGITGFGLGAGGSVAAEIIRGHLSHLLIGTNPLNVELLWEQLYTSGEAYGRRGVFVMALSGVDNALWDILGKATGQPVYRLLGGTTKEKIPIYQTALNDAMFEDGLKQGVKHFKASIQEGVAEGRDGMKRTIQRLEGLRQKIGPENSLMIDCNSRWNDLEYTLEMARRLEPVKLYCIEEPLSPDNVTGYERLVREISSTRIASGEHEYTHHGFAELIRHQAVDVLQPDVTWCGGVTAVRKVAAMAAEHGLEFTPHRGGSLFGLPLCLSSTQCQWAESFGTNEPSSELMAAMMSPYRDGFYFPSEQPGFGTTLTEEMIKRHLVA
jgi:L-rhamnonate dehydratase